MCKQDGSVRDRVHIAKVNVNVAPLQMRASLSRTYKTKTQRQIGAKRHRGYVFCE